MKRLPPRRAAALLALGCLFTHNARLSALQAVSAGEPEGSSRGVSLGRARALEQRGRFDLARQEWTQVLAADPGNAEALAGMVRAARAEGHAAEAAQFLGRLKAAHPQSPELTQLEGRRTPQDTTAELAEATRLEQGGDPRGALVVLRRLYGATPPPGTPALAYYSAESALDESRPDAVAGLRALADRYPNDSRYGVALGRVLLRSPRTRAEGRTLLERFPENGDAVAALRSSASPEDHVARATPALAKPSPAVPFSSSVAPTPLPAPRRLPETATAAERPTTVPTPGMRSVAATGREALHRSYAAQEQTGFNALNQHRAAEAEQIFTTILSHDPTNPRALAGMGYLRVTAGDTKAAVNFFERAQENGDRSLALTRALVSAQNQLSLQKAHAASTAGDLATAEGQYRAVLRDRPADPDALQGLGQLLLGSSRPAEAIPVFSRLTEIRPLNPEAWRGLVIAQSSAGRGSNALATDAHVPAEAREPLATDSSYLQALATARGTSSPQVARAEHTPPPGPPTPARPAEPRPAQSYAQQPPPAKPVSPAQTATKSQPGTEAQQASSGQPMQQAPPSPSPAPTPRVPPVSSSSASAVADPKAALSAGHPMPLTPPPAPAVAENQNSAGRRVLPSVELPGTPAPSTTRPASPAMVARTTPASRSRRRGAHGATEPPSASVATVTPPMAAVPVAPPPSPSPAVAIAAERLAQGNAALGAGENPRAAELFRASLAAEPDRAEAWRGLVTALHAAGRDPEAVSALAQMPDGPRTVLERDATFQAAVGALYLSSARPGEALRALVRAQEVFASQHLQPPLDLVLRLTTLLAARNDDGNLYRELMYLGQRSDMTDVQRRDVQMIWTRWAVRRARALAVAGEQRRAVVILNAAAEAFSGNPEVLGAVAGGYAGVGLPREAVALLKTQNLQQASARELEAAIAAGIAAHDFRAANGWARLGQSRFPSDPEMLTAIAELEQARGHNGHAVELTQQARALAPRQDPAAVLTAELREAPAGHGWGPVQGGQLATLLSPTLGSAAPLQTSRPFLPVATTPGNSADRATQTPILSSPDEPAR